MPDISSLCAPISVDQPTGSDMALSREFDAIVEARRADDPSLPQGDWVTELKTADWPRVASLCADLLCERSKDIRLCVWLAEAWGQEHGVSGLVDGVNVLTCLCESNWPALHPLPQDDDDEIRLASIEKLAFICERLLRSMPLAPGEAMYNYRELLAARQEAQRPAATDEAEDDPRARLTRIESAFRDADNTFYPRLCSDLDQLSLAFQQLSDVLQACLAQQAPGFADVLDTIAELKAAVAPWLRDANGPVPTSPAGQTLAAAVDGTSDMVRVGSVNSREQALAQLREVARYFRQNEPHSPVAYLADKAAAWGDMPLHDWLRSVMHDEGELARLEELLGT